MDKKAIYNLTYGVFMVSTKAGDVVNGCITNTCIQVANNPVRIAVSVLNSNYGRAGGNLPTAAYGTCFFMLPLL